MEGNRHSPFEADHAQPWPDVVAPGAALGKDRKPQAGRLDALNVGQDAPPPMFEAKRADTGKAWTTNKRAISAYCTGAQW